MTAHDILTNGKRIVEAKLDELLVCKSKKYKTLVEAMQYSTSSGGKRLRPALLLEFYRICGGKHVDSAAHFAAALEMIHTYSLIHDDLPCMDNDEMRRGKPSCHIAFGEDTALLAGDALLTKAFNAAATASQIEAPFVVRGIELLSYFAGVDGMVGGQVIDLAIENSSPSLDTVVEMYSLKTGALIVAAAQIGCILAGADEEKVSAAVKFAQKIGFAFQIVDDILDITSTQEELGKPIGSDEKNNKSTYVSLVGLEKAEKDVVSLTEEAISALAIFGEDAAPLCELARELTVRKN